MRYLFMCKSLTYAQRAEKALGRAGIHSNIIKSPSSLSTRGCGYSLSVSNNRGKHATEILKNSNLLQGKIYIQDDGGSFKEVRL